MDLDGLVAIASLVLYWRAVLCIIGAGALSFLVVSGNPWFTFGQGLAFVLVGFVVGVCIEELAARSAALKQSPRLPTSLATAMAAALVAGSTWGLASGLAGRPGVSGVILLVLSMAIWVWLFVLTKPKVQPRVAVLHIAAAGVGYLVGGFFHGAA